MLVEGHPEGVLIPGTLAPAVAALLRAGIDDYQRRDGIRVPRELHRLVDELDALARAAAACQANGPTRDMERPGPHRAAHAIDA